MEERSGGVRAGPTERVCDKCLYLSSSIKIRCQGRARVKKGIVMIWRGKKVSLIKMDIHATKKRLALKHKQTDKKQINE